MYDLYPVNFVAFLTFFKYYSFIDFIIKIYMLSDKFVNRHNGPREDELPQMLETIGVDSIDQLIEKTVPKSIMLEKPLRLPEAMSEFEYLNHIKSIGQKNKMFRSFIGQGYYGVAPSVGNYPECTGKSFMVHILHSLSG